MHSGIVAEELELICGGRYEIVDELDLDAEKIVVNLQFTGFPPLLETAS